MLKWRLIFELSLLGLLMGFATVWFIPFKSEIYFWLIIYIYSAYRIGNIHRGNYFLHGFLVSVLNGCWYALVHVFFYHEFIAFHPEELSLFQLLSLEQSPKFATLVTGPLFGAGFGLLVGTLSMGAYLLRKKLKKN
jgi:hypothetical protein